MRIFKARVEVRRLKTSLCLSYMRCTLTVISTPNPGISMPRLSQLPDFSRQKDRIQSWDNEYGLVFYAFQWNIIEGPARVNRSWNVSQQF